MTGVGRGGGGERDGKRESARARERERPHYTRAQDRAAKTDSSSNLPCCQFAGEKRREQVSEQMCIRARAHACMRVYCVCEF